MDEDDFEEDEHMLKVLLAAWVCFVVAFVLTSYIWA